jgi:hypothetical protein
MGDPSSPIARADCVSAEAERAKGERIQMNEGTQALALLERIASAVEFMAAQTGHVPTAPAQSPAETEQADAANNTESASA